MAGLNQVFGQIKGKAENFTSRIAESSIPDKNGSLLKTLKQQKSDLIQEKQKYFGYIGMAVYDLHREQGLEFQEFSMDLEKLDELDREIQEINQQIEEKEQEKMNAKKIICVNCGAKLDGKARFCAKCGTSVTMLLKEQEAGQPMNENEVKTCICGARIEAGQFMCMECGRKL